MKIEEIQSFIEKQTWTFAKTYAKKAPHEYIVRHKHVGDDEEFMAMVDYILNNGNEENYLKRIARTLFNGNLLIVK